MAISLTAQQKLQQTTRLSPQQIQVIRMLEIPTTELEQRIMQEVQDNPLLEIDEEQRGANAQGNTLDGGNLNDNENENLNDNLNDNGNDNLNDDDNINDNPDGADEEEYNEATNSYDYSDSSQNFDEEYSSEYDGYQDSASEYMLRVQNRSADEDVEVPFAAEDTFLDYLKEQLGEKHLSDREKSIGEYILGSLDSNGYLTRSTEQLVDELAFTRGQEVDDEEMERLVHIIRQLDPPGVGASNLKECMLLQLERLPQNENTQNAINIVNRCFEELSKRHYDRIQLRMDLSEEQMQQALNLILHINPKPGSNFSSTSMERNSNHVTPDFLVENDNGTLIVTLNDGDIPSLRISKDYQNMLATMTVNRATARQNKEGVRFLREHLDSARWFIDAIHQRNETLLKTMQEIVRFQHDFFIEGDDTFIRPMILQDIADRTGFDISTISRVSGEKYVRTEYGTYPLKHFFSEAIDDLNGEEISTRRIKKVLRELIQKEDKRQPYNDDELVRLLNEAGCKVARRTIAKYRDQLNIPVARLRKEV